MEKGEDYKFKQDKHAQLVYLKRRLEDLEQVHKEGKKQHASDLELLKDELDRLRKGNKEQMEYITKVKRQREASDAQTLELKKATQTAQLEARELRQKLRSAEQERDKLIAKQTDAADLRKALSAAESRKKGDLQEKERKIMELQKLLANERQRTVTAEGKSARLQATLDQQVQKLHGSEGELEEAVTAKEAFQNQIVQLQSYLRAAFEQYAYLKSTTVSKERHENLALESAQLRMRLARVERKLANSDDQVLELAHLIRQAQNTNKLLSYELSEAKSEIEWRVKESLISPSRVYPLQVTDGQSTIDEISDFLLEEQKFKNDVQSQYAATLRAQLELSGKLAGEHLTRLYAVEDILADKVVDADQLRHSLTRTEEAVVKLSKENKAQAEKIEQLTYLNEGHVKGMTKLQTKLEDASVSLVTTEARAKSDIVKLKEVLRKEKEVTTRLHSTLQQNKMAEEALKAEIDQLSEELATVECYREAYQSIADEMRGLVARNVLAEEETMRLSQFNAEILSHRNPTQKIYYVDRIRRELAEAKQKLATSTRDHEASARENDALRAELALFKSVAVPFAGKPRTNMTRVKRMPFAPVNKQIVTVNNKRELEEEENENCDDLARYLPDSDVGNMTVDELS